MLETRLLEHALAVAEHGSFAVAAQFLGLSQSALSRSIQSLEAQLDIQLFDRGHRRIEPTDAGQIFLQSAREIVARNAALLHEMGLVHQNQNGAFAISSGPYPAEVLLGSVLAKMTELHPELQFRLRVESWADAVKVVRNRETDLAVADAGQLDEDPDLVVVRLPSLQGYFVVRPGHPLLAESSLTPEQIFANPLVSTSRLPPRILAPLQQLRSAAGNPGAFPAILCEQVSVMRQVVAQSQAVGMFILSSIAAELRAGALVPLGYDAPWLSTQFGIIRLRNRPLSQAGESFLRCVRDEAEQVVARERELTARFAPKT